MSYLQSLAPAKPQNVFQTAKEVEESALRKIGDVVCGSIGDLGSGVTLLRRFGFCAVSKGVNIDTLLFGCRSFRVIFDFSHSKRRFESKDSLMMAANTTQLIRQLIEEIKKSTLNIYEQSDCVSTSKKHDSSQGPLNDKDFSEMWVVLE